jgi:hypothetical protein
VVVKHLAHYFETARTRYQIKLRREIGLPQHAWTEDLIFKTWRFTNVHREDDKTTVWFRQAVRGHVSGLRAIEACLIFRWFNRIETGHLIKDLLVDGWDTEEARRRLRDVKPLVTGAYMIHSPYGYNKLNGLLMAIDECRPRMGAWWDYVESGQAGDLTLATTYGFLRDLPNMGNFSAGEVVIDLRHTDVLNKARDINTWTVAGPGCAKGLGYMIHDDPKHWRYSSAADQREMLPLMLQVLEASRSEEYWPAAWTPWELHEVEMWACEYCKYRTAQEGGSLKRRFTL